MSVVYCPSCNVANSEVAERCHCCTGRLNRAADTDAAESCAMSNGDEFGYLGTERSQHAWLATKALISAAMLSIIRATIIPFLITRTPPGTLGQMNAQTIEMMGFFMALVFGIAAFYAMHKPMISVAVAFLLYLVISIPDLVNGHGVLGTGIISKGVMVLVLTRALIAGLQHQMMKRHA